MCLSSGRFGLRQKKGYSYYYITNVYEAASAKVTEFARSHLSSDCASTVSVDFNWADVSRSSCARPTTELTDFTDTLAMSTNCDYHHEKETFAILMSATDTVDFYQSRWAFKRPRWWANLRNKDQLVFEGLQSDYMTAQLEAEWTDVAISNIKLPAARKACKSIFFFLSLFFFFSLSLWELPATHTQHTGLWASRELCYNADENCSWVYIQYCSLHFSFLLSKWVICQWSHVARVPHARCWNSLQWRSHAPQSSSGWNCQCLQAVSRLQHVGRVCCCRHLEDAHDKCAPWQRRGKQKDAGKKNNLSNAPEINLATKATKSALEINLATKPTKSAPEINLATKAAKSALEINLATKATMSALKMNLTTKATMSALYKSACQQHSSVKVNCCFSEGMHKKKKSQLICVCILWKIWPEAEKRI